MKRILLLTLLLTVFIFNLNTAFSEGLSANIMRLVNAANLELDKAEKQIQTGKSELAPAKIKGAQQEYDNIFKYYKGSFDPKHPILVKLKDRIEQIREQSTNSSVKNEKHTSKAPPAPPQTGFTKLSANIRRQIDAADRQLVWVNQSAAKGEKDDSALAAARQEYANIFKYYKGSFDPEHPDIVALKKRIDAAEQAVKDGIFEKKSHLREEKAAVLARSKEATEKSKTALQAKQEARQAEADAKALQIMKKYPEMDIDSTLYKKNTGKIVWAAQIINFSDQDRITTKNSFNLSEPIFGRIYLEHSLGNTPVYGSSGGAQENRDFGYKFKLFIDGKEKTDRFGVFTSGNLNGKAGESWKTWQFAPNPVPADADFQKEANAWRRTTKDLAPGTHKVRFELWSKQGNFYSREPIAVGEFSLVVKKGDRISAGMKFPTGTYTGNDTSSLSKKLKNAMINSGKASAAEIIKLAITGNWVYNRYTDSKKEYRKISAAVLFSDKDNNGICRFATYNFISDKTGNGWTAPRFHSFCNGCPEGEVECSK